ncbi:MAG: hypothetical protein ACFFCS_15295 [Candidatus Hodarchaeota archaeon]
MNEQVIIQSFKKSNKEIAPKRKEMINNFLNDNLILEEAEFPGLKCNDGKIEEVRAILVEKITNTPEMKLKYHLDNPEVRKAFCIECRNVQLEINFFGSRVGVTAESIREMTGAEILSLEKYGGGQFILETSIVDI